MSHNWKQVWEGRRLDPAYGSMLARLMAADGLDTGFGNVEETAWRRYVQRTAAAIGITPQSSVFEVGCGAGAYILDLYDQGCTVAGLDASSAQIGYAREVMPNGQWQVAEAAELDPAEPYDFVIAGAVFLYFPSLEYSREVLERMVRKARYGVMVLDVPDLAKREETIAMRRRMTGSEDYDRKYDGLNHQYFDKAWFETTLGELGVKQVRVEDQQIEGYANAACRFNVFGWGQAR